MQSSKPPFSQLGRTVIVTGGASGFGEATVRWMVSRGANVVIADINEQKGLQLSQSIAKENGSVLFVKTDVTDPASWTFLIKRTIDEFGGLDVLVNNAGGSYVNKPSLEVTEDEFDKCFNLNVRSIFHSIAAVLPHFLSKKQGNIVNGEWVDGGLRKEKNLLMRDRANDVRSLEYCSYPVSIDPQYFVHGSNVDTKGLEEVLLDSSKYAVNGATKSLAVEYAATGVRINAVCPVAGHTPLLPTFLGKNSEEAFAATVPMGRLCEPEDVASAIGWLASDEARFITGVCFEVDGGRCI